MAELFHKTFATDLSEFGSTTASNGTITQSSGAGLNGTTGGVTCTATDSSPNVHGTTELSFVGKSFLRTAWYTNIASMTIGMDNQVVRLYEFCSTDSATTAAIVMLRRLSGALNIQHYIIDDSNTFLFNNIPLASGYPGWIELRIQRSSGSGIADAQSHLYFGGGDYPALGELVSTHTGVVHFTRMAQPSHRLGIRNGSVSAGGFLIIDEWTLRDDDTPIIYGVSTSTSLFFPYLRRRRRD